MKVDFMLAKMCFPSKLSYDKESFMPTTFNLSPEYVTKMFQGDKKAEIDWPDSVMCFAMVFFCWGE
jgi:hypothetical protein